MSAPTPGAHAQPAPRRASLATRIAALAVVLTALAVGAAVWLAATPYLAVAALRDAASRGDEKAISEGVDFPALRASVTAEVSRKGASAAAHAGPLGSLAGALAAPLAAAAVDAIVRPDVIAGLLRGRVPPHGGAKPAGERLPQLGYDGLDAFHVTFDGGGTPPVTLRFERRGLASWKLVGVTLP